jgi:hypothetical protein
LVSLKIIVDGDTVPTAVLTVYVTGEEGTVDRTTDTGEAKPAGRLLV